MDLYGTLSIKASNGLSCKIDFAKASYWSSKKHELYGTITDKSGKNCMQLLDQRSPFYRQRMMS